MHNLLVTAYPGDEAVYFGGLLQRTRGDWTVVTVITHPIPEESLDELLQSIDASSRILGASHTQSLNFPEMQVPLYSIEKIAEKLKTLSGYNRVFTYNIMDQDPVRQLVAVATAKAHDEITVRSMGGISDIKICLTPEEFTRKTHAINTNYPKRLVRRKGINASELKDVETYQRYRSSDLIKYYYENFRLPVFDFSDDPAILPTVERAGEGTTTLEHRDPWELARSEYEQERYRIEIAALQSIPWESIAEMGACEGSFTKKLVTTFPNRQVTAAEPDGRFFSTLQANVGSTAMATQTRVQDWNGKVDVLFVSSVLYYIVPFPQSIIETPAKYVVLSHHKLYHEQVIDPIMRAHGFAVLGESDLPGKIEPMWNVLDNKEGTNVKVWSRR